MRRVVEFSNRETMPSEEKIDPAIDRIKISPDAYHDARLEAPGWDVYHLESEWREWITEPPRNTDAAFIGFCRKFFQKRGKPK